MLYGFVKIIFYYENSIIVGVKITINQIFFYYKILINHYLNRFLFFIVRIMRYCLFSMPFFMVLGVKKNLVSKPVFILMPQTLLLSLRTCTFNK